ncbi:hypothetical protein H6F97_10895 [Microcoleus sp. FACHB-1]|nr:hypothetical protein [Microcoleus sp. FACHB-1]
MSVLSILLILVCAIGCDLMQLFSLRDRRHSRTLSKKQMLSFLCQPNLQDLRSHLDL